MITRYDANTLAMGIAAFLAVGAYMDIRTGIATVQGSVQAQNVTLATHKLQIMRLEREMEIVRDR